jgi:hypothetical protein
MAIMDAVMRQIGQEGYKRTPPISLYLRKPALHLSDIVRKSLSGRHLGTGAICSIVLSGQAPKLLSGAPKARGLTAKLSDHGCCGECRSDLTLSERSSTRFYTLSSLHFGSMSPGDPAPLGPYIAFAFTHIIFGPIPAKALWFE